jgi:hypothetical protein
VPNLWSISWGNGSTAQLVLGPAAVNKLMGHCGAECSAPNQQTHCGFIGYSTVYSGYERFGESAILKMKASDLSDTLLTTFQVFSKYFGSPVNYHSVKYSISLVYRLERPQLATCSRRTIGLNVTRREKL